MAHELEIKNGVAQMAYVGEVPWHGLGTELQPGATVEEILAAAGLNWEVGLYPAASVFEGEVITTDHFSLIRKDNKQVLDVVPQGWNPLQNSDAFDFFTRLTAEGSASMNTAGSIRDGEIVWGLAKMGETVDIVKGDPTESYLLLTNNHRYGKSISILLTPIRVVCMNTLTAALQGAAQKAVVKFAHNATFDPDLAHQALALASDRFMAYTERAKFLTTKKAEDEAFRRFLMQVFPAGGEAGKNNVPSLPATKAYEARESQPGAEFGAGTWWNAYNAVSYVTDHVLGQTLESRLNSAWYGPNAEKKRKAFDLALEYAEAA